MRSRQPKLNFDKTECNLVTENKSIQRNVDMNSVMLGNVMYVFSFVIAYGTLDFI